MLDSIIVGITKVRWVSAAGTLEGRVKRIDHAKNAAGEWIEWMMIEDIVRTDTQWGAPVASSSRIAATKSNIAMLKMEEV